MSWENEYWAHHPTLRKTGYLGEGGFMMRNNLYGMNVERMAEYDVVESRVHGWERFQGKSIEEALGLKNGEQAILGYINGNPVTAGGDKNYIENVFQMGNGKMRIQVRETVGFGTGTKIDPVKGLVHAVTNDEWSTIKEGLNRYHQAAGTLHYYVPPRRAHRNSRARARRAFGSLLRACTWQEDTYLRVLFEWARPD